MKIKNCIHFLLAILLLISGSTPVLAQTPDQCASVEPIRPGDRVIDDIWDVPAPHIDITEVETSLSGQRLTVVFHLRNLPETLRFNRTGLEQGTMEYAWGVEIDVDNDRSTGPGGFDMLLSAYHITGMSRKGTDADVNAPIGERVEASLWDIEPDGSISTVIYTIEDRSSGSSRIVGDGGTTVHVEADTITIADVIPGITSESRLAFRAYDMQFPGWIDQLACHDPSKKSAGSWGCSYDAVLIRPGQTATDEISDVSAAFLDIVEVSSFLSGETLTVAIRFRDIPETLTFNRTGTPTNSMEYSWGVSIDVDNDRRTGDGGLDYLLSAHHIVWPGHARDNTVAPMEEVAKADVWEMKPGGIIEGLRDASLEVLAETDMIVLSGRIPGITPDSRLSFKTFKRLGESDELGCQEPPVILKSSSRSASGDDSYALVGHIDIHGVMTAVEGETLTVTLQLRDIPETLTFNRSGVPEDALEYSWEVSVDVDADSETGNDGYDYMLSAAYFVPRFAQGSNTAAEITQPGFVRASLWGLDRKGYRVLAEADIEVEVSAAGNTITLSGEIPGITETSPLKFRAYDYFAGSVEMSTHGPPLMDLLMDIAVDRCQSDSAVIRPGQRVIDAVSDTLPAHVDITEVSTEMTAGGKLTVVFHLRDIPETLEFNRKGVSGNTQEYRWEVSVDVDNDRETGLPGLGAEYSLSASHFVLPWSSGEAAHLPVSQAVEGDVWKLDAEGTGARRDGINIDVSPEENTVTLIGHIPGITSASRLIFEAYDVLNGSELIACRALSGSGGGE